MRAASRETYAAALTQLNGIVATAEPAGLAAMGDELVSVAGLLAREPRLRRALSDPARSGDDRSALLDGLIANAVSADTRTVLHTVAAGRWSGPGELLDGVEQLGVQAMLAGAERAGDLGDVEDELFRFAQTVDGSPELASALGDNAVPAAQRASLVESLLGGKAKPTTARLATLALSGFELAADRRDRQVAYVTVANLLTAAEEQRLGTRLSAMYGREISLKITVDPSVLGGARVLIGSDLYDGTTLRRLTDARHSLTGN
jgi:F-type H+-transporting ATPase subunit delta